MSCISTNCSCIYAIHFVCLGECTCSLFSSCIMYDRDIHIRHGDKKINNSRHELGVLGVTSDSSNKYGSVITFVSADYI